MITIIRHIGRLADAAIDRALSTVTGESPASPYDADVFDVINGIGIGS